MPDTGQAPECFVCYDTGSEEMPLIPFGCNRHYVCQDPQSMCLKFTFECATNNESLWPVKCCGTFIEIGYFNDYVPKLLPILTCLRYQAKGQEYRMHPRTRVYCANEECGNFLHPYIYCRTLDGVQYARCVNCLDLTCTTCGKSLFDRACRIAGCGECESRPNPEHSAHACNTEKDESFLAVCKEHNFKQCDRCGNMVELADACNHITCICDYEFCYICGKRWLGLHSCPRYGQPVYDAEGFNQDGFHRNTGLNRDGAARFWDELEPEDDDAVVEEPQQERMLQAYGEGHFLGTWWDDGYNLVYMGGADRLGAREEEDAVDEDEEWETEEEGDEESEEDDDSDDEDDEDYEDEEEDAEDDTGNWHDLFEDRLLRELTPRATVLRERLVPYNLTHEHQEWEDALEQAQFSDHGRIREAETLYWSDQGQINEEEILILSPSS